MAEQGEKIKNFFSPKKHYDTKGAVPTYGPPPPVYNDGYNAPTHHHPPPPPPPVYNDAPPVYQDTYKAPVRNPGYAPPQHRPVKFDSAQPVVVKHEHHHYYHGGNNNNQAGNQVQFGFDGGNNFQNNNNNNNNFGFGNGPQFLGRTNLNESDIEAGLEGLNNGDNDNNNNVKRNTNFVSFGAPESAEEPEKKESGFKFPAGRSIESNRRRRSPEDEVEIKAVKLKETLLRKRQKYFRQFKRREQRHSFRQHEIVT